MVSRVLTHFCTFEMMTPVAQRGCPLNCSRRPERQRRRKGKNTHFWPLLTRIRPHEHQAPDFYLHLLPHSSLTREASLEVQVASALQYRCDKNGGTSRFLYKNEVKQRLHACETQHSGCLRAVVQSQQERGRVNLQATAHFLVHGRPIPDYAASGWR